MTAALDVFEKSTIHNRSRTIFLVLEENFATLSSRRISTSTMWTELHGGFEYRNYQRRWTWAQEWWFFTDPDHPMRFRALPDTDPLARLIAEFRFNSLKQETNLGVTFGGGVAISNRIQFDIAYSQQPRRSGPDRLPRHQTVNCGISDCGFRIAESAIFGTVPTMWDSRRMAGTEGPPPDFCLMASHDIVFHKPETAQGLRPFPWPALSVCRALRSGV